MAWGLANQGPQQAAQCLACQFPRAFLRLSEEGTGVIASMLRTTKLHELGLAMTPSLPPLSGTTVCRAVMVFEAPRMVWSSIAVRTRCCLVWDFYGADFACSCHIQRLWLIYRLWKAVVRLCSRVDAGEWETSWQVMGCDTSKCARFIGPKSNMRVNTKCKSQVHNITSLKYKSQLNQQNEAQRTEC